VSVSPMRTLDITRRFGRVSFDDAVVPTSAVLGEMGVEFLMRQVRQISGGTIEMSRNAVSERLLGMPREARRDNDVAFRDVPRSAPSR